MNEEQQDQQTEEVLSEAEQKEREAEKERERQEALRAEGGQRYDGGPIPR